MCAALAKINRHLVSPSPRLIADPGPASEPPIFHPDRTLSPTRLENFPVEQHAQGQIRSNLVLQLRPTLGPTIAGANSPRGARAIRCAGKFYAAGFYKDWGGWQSLCGEKVLVWLECLPRIDVIFVFNLRGYLIFKVNILHLNMYVRLFLITSNIVY